MGTPLFSSSFRRNPFGKGRLARLESQREAQCLAPSASSPIRLRCAILVRSPCPPPHPLPSDPSSQTTLPCFPPHLSSHVGVPMIDVAGPMRPHVHRTLPRCAQGAPRARRERRRAAAAAASAQDVPGVRGHESRVAHVRSFFGSRGRSCVRCARPRRGSWSFALRCTQWCARSAVRRRRWPSSS